LVGVLKKLYLQFIALFSVLLLCSSAFVDPRSWWSIREITEFSADGFSSQFSWIKISCYALIVVTIVGILNIPLAKRAFKTIMKLGVIKLQLLLNNVRTLLN